MRVLLIIGMVLLVGCSRILPPGSGMDTRVFEQRCRPPDMPRNISLSGIDSPVGESGARPEQLPLPDVFSARSLAAAAAIEALPQLKDIGVLEGRHEDTTIQILKARTKLIGRILLAMEEVSSVTAELECESNRADQVADRLQDEQSTRTKYQTLAAIIIAGVGSVASGGVILAGLTTAEAAVAIGGGTLAAGLGTIALFAESHQDFRHPRNLLRDVWEGPSTSTTFPKSVWRYMNQQPKQELEGKTHRMEVIASWRQDGRLGEPGSASEEKRLPLLFGEGGLYELQDLRARSAMLGLLASAVEMMHQDLELLIREVLIQEALE